MSTINVTNLRGKGGTSPNLPDGAVIIDNSNSFESTIVQINKALTKLKQF